MIRIIVVKNESYSLVAISREYIEAMESAEFYITVPMNEYKTRKQIISGVRIRMHSGAVYDIEDTIENLCARLDIELRYAI